MAETDVIADFPSDSRTPCKYGNDCYQKNKSHHEKYKHPHTISEEKKDTDRPLKKKKLNLFETKDWNLFKVNKTLICSMSPKRLSDGDQIEKDNPFISCNSLNDKIRPPVSKKVNLKKDPKEVLKQLFLVEMPDDFFSFWDMCGTLNEKDPSSALKEIKLKLVGPFDVLAGKINEVYEEDLPKFLTHWRYYYDPPEFQTVLASSDCRCFHMGYYRDDPKEMPVFVTSNVFNPKNSERNGELKVVGQNLFAALNVYMEELKTDPFSRMKLPKFQKILTTWAKEKGFSLETSSKQMESRNRKIVAKTFHGAGIVVPVDKKNDVGYRELAASNSMIKKMLKSIVESKSEEERKKYWEQLQPVITFANIANDECDFGTSLELGLDLFTFGSPLLHRSARQLLTTAYGLLGRTEFVKIIEAHLDNRRQGGSLSVL